MAANFKFVLYTFQLASLTLFRSKNYFELSTKTRLVRLILTLTKEFIIGSHLWKEPVLEMLASQTCYST